MPHAPRSTLIYVCMQLSLHMGSCHTAACNTVGQSLAIKHATVTAHPCGNTIFKGTLQGGRQGF
jgi:hypothetical protein